MRTLDNWSHACTRMQQPSMSREPLRAGPTIAGDPQAPQAGEAAETIKMMLTQTLHIELLHAWCPFT
jgi:hypothetical protein